MIIAIIALIIAIIALIITIIYKADEKEKSLKNCFLSVHNIINEIFSFNLKNKNAEEIYKYLDDIRKYINDIDMLLCLNKSDLKKFTKHGTKYFRNYIELLKQYNRLIRECACRGVFCIIAKNEINIPELTFYEACELLFIANHVKDPDDIDPRIHFGYMNRTKEDLKKIIQYFKSNKNSNIWYEKVSIMEKALVDLSRYSGCTLQKYGVIIKKSYIYGKLFYCSFILDPLIRFFNWIYIDIMGSHVRCPHCQKYHDEK